MIIHKCTKNIKTCFVANLLYQRKKGKKYNARAYPYMDKNQKDNKIRIK